MLAVSLQDIDPEAFFDATYALPTLRTLLTVKTSHKSYKSYKFNESRGMAACVFDGPFREALKRGDFVAVRIAPTVSLLKHADAQKRGVDIARTRPLANEIDILAIKQKSGQKGQVKTEEWLEVRESSAVAGFAGLFATTFGIDNAPLLRLARVSETVVSVVYRRGTFSTTTQLHTLPIADVQELFPRFSDDGPKRLVESLQYGAPELSAMVQKFQRGVKRPNAPESEASRQTSRVIMPPALARSIVETMNQLLRLHVLLSAGQNGGSKRLLMAAKTVKLRSEV